jgi:predicted nucleic acid-binding protein
MYLVDTNVLSEMRKTKMDIGVASWLRGIDPSDFHVSVISLLEVARGAERQQKIDPVFARRLESWLDTVIARYSDTILFIDAPIAKRWGKLQIQLQRNDLDVAIAATALERDLAVVTRNVEHFKLSGLNVINPFKA